jgi:hypothetical protein
VCEQDAHETKKEEEKKCKNNKLLLLDNITKLK